MKKYIIVLVALCLYSCAEDAKNIEIPEFVRKVVVYSFISPADTQVVVKLSYNWPVFGELKKDTISQGEFQLFLSNGENEEILVQQKDSFLLDTKKMAILPDHKYYLRIANSFGNVATSECSIPKEKEISVTIDTTVLNISYTYGWKEEKIRATLRFTDSPKETNYYRIVAYKEIFFPDIYWQSAYNNSYIIADILLTDKNNDGNELIASFDFTNIAEQEDSAKLKILLLETDKNYYEYHHSLKHYEYDDYPFSESSVIYTNINGGLGVFGGYVQYEFTLRLK